MKKSIIHSIIFIPLLLSCISEKGIAFIDIPQYESNDGYKNLYIVDTIQIDTPIRFFTKSGYEFVMAKRYFDLFNSSEKDLFESNNAFLVGDLPLGLPKLLYKQYYNENNCSMELLPITKHDIRTVYHYKTNPYFVLLLINGNYFNSAFIGIDGASPIKDKRKKFNYYKVVIPVCP